MRHEFKISEVLVHHVVRSSSQGLNSSTHNHDHQHLTQGNKNNPAPAKNIQWNRYTQKNRKMPAVVSNLGRQPLFQIETCTL